VAVGAVDDRLIDGAVASAVHAKVDGNLLDVGGGEIVDGDLVGAGQGPELDLLDIVEVHHHAGDVTGEPRVAAIGRDVDRFGDGGAVEGERVVAVLAVDRVTAVTRVPDERVVAGAKPSRVVAASTDDQVVAVATQQEVVAVAAGDGVVAVAAVDGELDQVGQAIARRDGI